MKNVLSPAARVDNCCEGCPETSFFKELLRLCKLSYFVL